MLRFPKLLAFAAGLLSAVGFAPVGAWPVTILAFALLLALLARAPDVRGAAAIGWWFGFGQFAIGLNWIATAFTFQAAMPAWLGWVAVVLLSLYLALYPMLATAVAWWGARRLGDRTGRAQPRPGMPFVTVDRLALGLLLAATWLAGEYLRGTVFTGFAWNPVGVVLVDRSIVHLAPLIGTYGLSSLVIVMAALVERAIAGPDRRDAIVPAAILLVAQVLALVWSGNAPPPTPHPIRIVQPNIGQEDKWSPAFAAQNFERLATLSGRPGPRPRLLLWPEAAVPEYLEIDPAARARLAGLLGPRDILLTGGVSLVGDAAGTVVAARNSLFAIDAQARILGRYDKAHLVPYGEYLPMRPVLSALGLSRLAPGDLDFLAGPGPRDLAVPGFGTVGLQICYEMVFSGHVVDRAHRPDVLFNPSNDAWFGRWGPPQHLAQARLRAVEEGLPVLRSTPTGISAVIDADGRLLNALPWQRPGSIDALLPAPKPATPFARFGNWLSGLWGLLLIAGAIARARLAR